MEKVAVTNGGEIIVTVGKPGAIRRKRFLGQRLVRWLQAALEGKGMDIVTVYRTVGNGIVLHTRNIPEWKLEWGDPDYTTNPKNWWIGKGLLYKLMTWGYDWEWFKGHYGNFTLHTFESLEGLKAHVSDALYRAVIEAMEEPEIETLDN